MTLRTCIKVPLVLIENVLFSAFPTLRPLIERYLFNPLDFKKDHITYSQKKFTELERGIAPFMQLEGKTILELGPGGSIGVGLLALEKGSKHYIAIDDGTHTFIRKKQLRYYKELLGSMEALHLYFQRTRTGITYKSEIIQYVSIDQASHYPLEDASVDIIYSCAVLEHVHDLDLCFQEMTRVLRPGGIMYHEVDLRDHIFSQNSLWFLTVPEQWFRRLFRNTGGYVNRKRLSDYSTIAKIHELSIIYLNSKKNNSPSGITEKLRSLYTSEDLEIMSFSAIFQKH